MFARFACGNEMIQQSNIRFTCCAQRFVFHFLSSTLSMICDKLLTLIDNKYIALVLDLKFSIVFVVALFDILWQKYVFYFLGFLFYILRRQGIRVALWCFEMRTLNRPNATKRQNRESDVKLSATHLEWAQPNCGASHVTKALRCKWFVDFHGWPGKKLWKQVWR